MSIQIGLVFEERVDRLYLLEVTSDFPKAASLSKILSYAEGEYIQQVPNNWALFVASHLLITFVSKLAVFILFKKR